MHRLRLPCPHPNCPAVFKSQHGRTYHIRAVHTNFNSLSFNREHDQGHHAAEQDGESVDSCQWDTVPLDNNAAPSDGGESESAVRGERIQHPHLTGECPSPIDFLQMCSQPNRTRTSYLALPCDSDGNFLPPGTMPPPRRETQQGDWAPFDNRVQFEVADFLFRDAELSAPKVDALLDLWAQSLSEFDSDAPASGPMKDHRELHALIDSSTLGDVPWQCMVATFDKDNNAPPWARTDYEIWYRNPEIVVSNMVANPDFDGQFDLRPYIDLDEHKKRRWSDVMSGNIAWRHSVSRTLVISWGTS